MSADPTFIWTVADTPKRSQTGLKPFETVGKQLYLLILTFIWKKVDAPKMFETDLKPFETVGKQLYLLTLHLY